MIYWQFVFDFKSACKLITYLTYEEFEHILHTPEEKLREEFEGITAQQAISFKRACRHYTHLRKLDLATQENPNHHISAKHAPKLEYAKIGDFTEVYWWNRDQTEKKKVCGYPLKGHAKGFVCLNDPGKGTLHKGYGYCMEHEQLATIDEKKALWAGLHATFGNVPTFKDILDRAQTLSQTAMADMDADLQYLEIARVLLIQAIQRNEEQAQAIQAGGGAVDTVFDRNRRMDLAMLSDISSKIKERRKKTEQMNYIPPEQVGVIVLQVLEAVTKGESPEVRARIAARAQDLNNILIPTIDENPKEAKVPRGYTKPMEESISRAKEIIKEHGGIEEAAWTDQTAPPKIIPGVKQPNYRHGYKKERPVPPAPQKLNLTFKGQNGQGTSTQS